MSNTEFYQLIVPYNNLEKLHELLSTCAETGVYLDSLITMVLIAMNNHADLPEIMTMVQNFTSPLLTDYTELKDEIDKSLVVFIGQVYSHVVLAEIVLPIRNWSYEWDGIRIISGGFDEYQTVTQIKGYY